MGEHGPTPLALVHRNRNPTNVRVSRNGGAVRIGFGRSRRVWLPEVDDERDAGELAYMALERIGGPVPRP